MTERGIIAYDLAGNWCEECGRAKSYRLFSGTLTGCKTCDEVITRHRCTSRPDITALPVGASWTCPDCDSTWTVTGREEPCEDCCGDCGHTVPRRRWEVAEGAWLATAPRYKPEPFAPFRSAFTGRRLTPPPLPKECHRTPGGIMIHVKPGCRCKK